MTKLVHVGDADLSERGRLRWRSIMAYRKSDGHAWKAAREYELSTCTTRPESCVECGRTMPNYTHHWHRGCHCDSCLDDKRQEIMARYGAEVFEDSRA